MNAPNKTADRLCTFMSNQIAIDTDYAALYRRCNSGMDGEMEAHKYEKYAVALRTLVASNCARWIDEEVCSQERPSRLIRQLTARAFGLSALNGASRALAGASPKHQEREIGMSKGKLATAVTGLLLMTAVTASAQDLTPVVQGAFEKCKSGEATMKQKYGRTLGQGDLLYCSCLAGASAMSRAIRQGASDATLERVVDACQAGFQGAE
jgi:hypothetical protein